MKLTGEIASATIGWMAEDHSREDACGDAIAFSLATFVDGTAITPLGYDETHKFDVLDRPGPFPNEICPCGDRQPDPERLYCDDCLKWMAEDYLETDEEVESDG